MHGVPTKRRAFDGHFRLQGTVHVYRFFFIRQVSIAASFYDCYQRTWWRSETASSAATADQTTIEAVAAAAAAAAAAGGAAPAHSHAISLRQPVAVQLLSASRQTVLIKKSTSTAREGKRVR